MAPRCRRLAREYNARLRPVGAVLPAAAALAAVPGRAAADRDAPGAASPRAAARAPDEVDVANVKPDMVVLHDGHGHYVALLPMREVEMTFYGDGRTFHQLRIFTSTSD